MIIGNILGYNKGDSDHFAVRNPCAHIGLMVKNSHGSIDKDKRCFNPCGVHEHSFVDVDLSKHIVTKFFMGIN